MTARPLLWMMGIVSGGVDYFGDCPRGFDWLLPLILGTDGDGWLNNNAMTTMKEIIFLH